MVHEILPVGMLRCNCSIFGDESTGEAIVIDPGGNLADVQRILNKHQLRVKAIVITHAHIDHIAGADQLRKSSGAPVYMNEGDQELSDRLDMQAAWLGVETPPNPGIDVPAREGDVLMVGKVPFHVLHTPGHTQGSISLWIPGGRQTGSRRYPVSGKHWTDGFARRKRQADSCFHPREINEPAGRNSGDSRPWGEHHNWS